MPGVRIVPSLETLKKCCKGVKKREQIEVAKMISVWAAYDLATYACFQRCDLAEQQEI